MPEPPPEKRRALVIGIDHAPKAVDPALHRQLNATADATAMAEVLQKYGKFELIRPPMVGAVTSDQVKEAVFELEAGSTEHDFLLLYFAGHGYGIPICDEAQFYLVTHNFVETWVEKDENMHVSMGWLRDHLYQSETAGKVLVIFDCCYAGHFGRSGPDPYLAELQARFLYYFDTPPATSKSFPNGLRQALSATGNVQLAYEKEGHGILTYYLLQALRGLVDKVIDLRDRGSINLWLLQDYLHGAMPEKQKPALSGGNASHRCILAWHEERARELLAQLEATRARERDQSEQRRPESYIPLPHDELYNPRPGEFERITALLFPDSQPQQPTTVGLVGLGGIGKSRLATELAFEYEQQKRFPGGIFWLQMLGDEEIKVQQQLADLSILTHFRPEHDNPANPDNRSRASFLARYLGERSDRLLILDNVDDIKVALASLQIFVGHPPRCKILYTSRNAVVPSPIKKHDAQKLTDEQALDILLTYPLELAQESGQELPASVKKDAKFICEKVHSLPLALCHLRDLLRGNALTVSDLRKQLRQSGVFALTSYNKSRQGFTLFQTFYLSLQHVAAEPEIPPEIGPDIEPYEKKDIRSYALQLFAFAALFPATANIPLWLLGLLLGLNDDRVTLYYASMALEKQSLVTPLAGGTTISLHPLVRDFGQQWTRSLPEWPNWKTGGLERLLATFADPQLLEERARADYWSCLSDLRTVLIYASNLGLSEVQVQLLSQIAGWMAYDGARLKDEDLWPDKLPNLFHQQLKNHLFDVGHLIDPPYAPAVWLNQLMRVNRQGIRCERELPHPGAVRAVAFAPDGRLASVCHDGSVRFWNAESGQPLPSSGFSEAVVQCLDFSPDKKLIVHGEINCRITLWDMESEKLLYELQDIDKTADGVTIRSIVFSQDASSIAVAQSQALRVWEREQPRLRWEVLLKEQEAAFESVCYSPDGRYLASCDDVGTVVLWDAANGKRLATVIEESLSTQSVAFSADSRYLVVGIPPDVPLWDVEQRAFREPLDRTKLEKHSFIMKMMVSPDGRFIGTAHKDNLAKITSLADGTVWLNCMHNDLVSDIAFSPSQNLIATCSWDNTIRIWKFPQIPLESVVAEDDPGPAKKMCFSADGQLLAVSHEKLAVQIWDVPAEAMRRVITLEQPLHKNEARAANIAISAGGEQLATEAFHQLELWDVKEGAQLMMLKKDMASLPVMDDYNNLAFSQKKDMVVLGGMLTGVIRRSTEAQRWEYQPLLPAPRGGIRLVACAPDDRYFVTVPRVDSRVFVWEKAARECIAVLKPQLAWISAVSISSDASLVAFGDSSGIISLWNMPNERLFIQLKGHHAEVTVLAFCPDERLLASSDQNGQLRIWHIEPQGVLTLLAQYQTEHKIGAIHWVRPSGRKSPLSQKQPESRDLILADLGGTAHRPYFYWLRLEGI